MHIDIQTLQTPGFANRPMFHPKAGRAPDGTLLMALQTIGGGDYYGPVEYSRSADEGRSWSPPQAAPPLGWQPVPGFPGVIEGVCDTVVDCDPASGNMVFLGHNVFYRDNRFLDTLGSWDRADRNDRLKRRGAYAVLRPDGSWSDRYYFDPAEFGSNVSFCCGCGQRVVRDNGEWLVAFSSMRSPENQASFVTVYRARLEGDRFTLLEHGNLLEHPVARGLLEPSLIAFGDRILLTLRAEDGCGYWSESTDGLNFVPIQPWRFDDGASLVTSTTQQHFLAFGDRLFLSYVRNAGYNARVPRFRAPLFMAEVNPESMKIIAASERIVFPVDGDLQHPETVALSGNFMPVKLNDRQWLILDGQCVVVKPFRSMVKIARLTL